jgi:hypothetical protein
MVQTGVHWCLHVLCPRLLEAMLLSGQHGGMPELLCCNCAAAAVDMQCG